MSIYDDRDLTEAEWAEVEEAIQKLEAVWLAEKAAAQPNEPTP